MSVDRRIWTGLAVLVTVWLAGCAWTDKSGVTHVVVLGVGVIQRAQTNGVTAFDLKAAGVVLDHGFSVGLIQQHHLEINPTAASNVIVSIRSNPGGLTVTHFEALGGVTNPPASLLPP